ncbi:MAG: nuclear transport factor 2 family protein [Novosphingobium sp.]|nr:nuclear transport factor 2 family protein [Novosphingobium sp.]
MWRKRKAKLARRFLDALCAGDAAVVDALMAEDVSYIDGRGNQIDGFAACSAAARAFHKLEPNYRFDVAETTVRGDTVMFRGTTEAQNPALCGELLVYARLHGDRIREWQVYRHNAPALARILQKMSE